ncbi:MAG: hypothetical protein HY291_16530 [Planctomycetes bacterium]|nr:hypothetical protein [Planctomycetota bacterium]
MGRLLASFLLAGMVAWFLAPMLRRPAHAGPVPPAANAETAPEQEWGFALYLPYDNDLAPAAELILKDLRETPHKNTALAAQVDLPGPGGMARHDFTASGEALKTLPSDDSASADQAATFFEWFVRTHPCKAYVFAVLGHGGKLDEACLDTQPAEKWMSGQALGHKLRELRERTKADVRLLFLQQCGRASLENLYGYRGAADCLLASPVNVGSPNTYYKSLLAWLERTSADASSAVANPNDGAAVAAQIAEADRHYLVYACVKSSALMELPQRLNTALKPILEKDVLAGIPAQQRVYLCDGEACRDARTCLTALAKANGTEKEMAEFWEWAERKLCVQVWHAKKVEAVSAQLSGLSLFWPATPAEAIRYESLDLYKASRLPHLWSRLCPCKNTGPLAALPLMPARY